MRWGAYLNSPRYTFVCTCRGRLGCAFPGFCWGWGMREEGSPGGVYVSFRPGAGCIMGSRGGLFYLIESGEVEGREGGGTVRVQ